MGGHNGRHRYVSVEVTPRATHGTIQGGAVGLPAGRPLETKATSSSKVAGRERSGFDVRAAAETPG